MFGCCRYLSKITIRPESDGPFAVEKIEITTQVDEVTTMVPAGCPLVAAAVRRHTAPTCSSGRLVVQCAHG